MIFSCDNNYIKVNSTKKDQPLFLKTKRNDENNLGKEFIFWDINQNFHLKSRSTQTVIKKIWICIPKTTILTISVTWPTWVFNLTIEFCTQKYYRFSFKIKKKILLNFFVPTFIIVKTLFCENCYYNYNEKRALHPLHKRFLCSVTETLSHKAKTHLHTFLYFCWINYLKFICVVIIFGNLPIISYYKKSISLFSLRTSHVFNNILKIIIILYLRKFNCSSILKNIIEHIT